MKFRRHNYLSPPVCTLDFGVAELPTLMVALDDAIGVGCDHGSVLSAMRDAIAAGCEPLSRLADEPPPVLLGPGGDFRTPWPPTWPELDVERVGPDPGAAARELLPQGG